MKLKNLFLTLVLTAVSMTAWAQSGTCGDNLTWTLENGTLTISGTGAMTDYNWHSTPWYSYYASITTVVIANGVTSIGEWAFGDCTALTSVSLGNTVEFIKLAAFDGCSSLTSIELPALLTRIENKVFANSGLTSITIPNNVTTIGHGAFNGCTGLTSITIPDIITSIEAYVFGDCTGLTSIDVEWNNPASILYEEAIFYGLTVSGITLNVPAGKEQAYRAVDVWKDFNITERVPVTGEARLESLTVDEGRLSPAFTPNTTSYTVTTVASAITLSASAINSEATITGIGKKSLNFGENTFKITVTSEDGSNHKTYTVTVSRVENYLERRSDYEDSFVPAVFAFVVGGTEYKIPADIIAGRNLYYTLTTGNAGMNGLSFNLEDGRTTCNTSTDFLPNSIYTIKLHVAFEPDAAATMHMDAYGRPSSVTISYTDHSYAISASGNGTGTQLSTETLMLPAKWLTDASIEDVVYEGSFTSITETPGQEAITIFPNPAAESFRINGIAEATTVIVSDLTGKTVLRQTVNPGEAVSVNRLPQGVYVVYAGGKAIKLKVKN